MRARKSELTSVKVGAGRANDGAGADLAPARRRREDVYCGLFSSRPVDETFPFQVDETFPFATRANSATRKRRSFISGMDI